MNLSVWPAFALPSWTWAYSGFGLCGHGLHVSALCGHHLTHLHIQGCIRFWQIIFSYFGSLELKGFSVLFMLISQRKCFMTIWLGLVHENLKMLLHILHHPIIQRQLVLKPLYSITGIFLTLMFSVFRIFTPSPSKKCVACRRISNTFITSIHLLHANCTSIKAGVVRTYLLHRQREGYVIKSK